jgi:competence protein ComEC
VFSRFFDHGARLAAGNKADRGRKVRTCVRPLLPLLFLPLALFWAALAISEVLVWRGIYLGLWPLLMLLPSFLWLYRVHKKGSFKKGARALRITILAVCALALGLSQGASYWQSLSDDARKLTSAELKGITLQVESETKKGQLGSTCEARISEPGYPGLRLRLFWPTQENPAPLGSYLRADLAFKGWQSGQEDFFRKGLCGSASLSKLELLGFERADGPPWAAPLSALYQIRQANLDFLATLDGPGAALLAGMVLGSDTSMDGSGLRQDWQTSGVAHLIAVSGSHLAVIASILAWLLARLKSSRRFAFVALAVCLAAYVVLTAFQASAIRAALMALVASSSCFAGRRSHAPSALCLAITGMLAFDPSNAFSLGLALSGAAVLGICLFNGLIQENLIRLCLPSAWQPAQARAERDQLGVSLGKGRPDFQARRKLPAFLQSALEAISLTLTAQAATAPLCLISFNTLPLVAPLANLLVTPLSIVLVGAGIALCCLLPMAPLAPIAAAGLSMLSIIGDLCCSLVTLLAGLPGAAVALSPNPFLVLSLSLLAAILLYHFWPLLHPSWPNRLVAVASCIVLTGLLLLSPAQPPQLVMMDVGQGDSLLIREGQHAILIDTGPSESALRAALARQGVRHLDAVVISHLDSDHVGALSALRGLVTVDTVFFAKGLLTYQAGHPALAKAKALVGTEKVQELSIDDRLRLSPALSARMVWPLQPAQRGDNPDSICLLLEYDPEQDGRLEGSALLCGDAEQAELTQSMAAGKLRQADVVKLGHHGSADDISAAQLRTLSSKLCLISVGAHNRYGHPTAATLEVCAEADQQVLRSDQCGDVSVTFKQDGLAVASQEAMG